LGYSWVEWSSGGEPNSTVITLTDPIYDAATGTLRFRANVLLREDAPESLDGVGGPRHSDPPASFDSVSLFIDDINGYASTTIPDWTHEGTPTIDPQDVP